MAPARQDRPVPLADGQLLCVSTHMPSRVKRQSWEAVYLLYATSGAPAHGFQPPERRPCLKTFCSELVSAPWAACPMERCVRRPS